MGASSFTNEYIYGIVWNMMYLYWLDFFLFVFIQPYTNRVYNDIPHTIFSQLPISMA